MSTCNVEHISLLLADQLPESLQSQVAEHVSQCEDCRRSLESLAGDASWWSEVESCFRANAGGFSVVASGNSSSLDDSGSGADSFATDFVVDFLEPCDRPEAIGRLDEYEIQKIIGRGGMGIVLKGFHRELGRYVAVKIMAPHLGTSGAARQRFVREARAAAAIVHPSVMPIHAVCTTARLPYLIMPFVACESLQQRIDRRGLLEVKEILRIGTQVAAGLAAAHAQGLVHRDVKPANILLEKGVDRVMLTDFGLARAADDGSLTRSGVVTGTPQYMSPEQAQGESIDARSDLFSLGSVLYTMASGRPPFRAETSLGILRRISDTQPRPIREVNPDVPEWLAAFVQKLHEKLPEARFQTSGEVAELLEQCLSHIQQPTVSPLPESLRTRSPSKAPRRHHRFALCLAGIAAAALFGVAIWQLPTRLENAPREQVAPEVSPSVGELSDDAASRESEDFRGQLGQLEERVGRSWDQSALSDNQPQPTQVKDEKQ